MIRLCVVFAILVGANAGPATEASFKGQYCVDPRTMRKHAAYTEWADAYSCTRHRCQPGGRNLAIYTVGCKRVEAPESAIECEEVVEDTNMQFPYCCTRLRCLVVVRGEVWTRVLGQPWETLPAAPWSHMYKMKKPPPGAENSFLPKLGEGPVYELQRESMTDDENGNKVLRSKKSKGGEAVPEDCSTDVSHAAPAAAAAAQQPDIVIALSTNLDKEPKKEEIPATSSASKSMTNYQRGRSSGMSESFFEEDAQRRGDREREPPGAPREDPPGQKPSDPAMASEEKYNNYATTQKPYKTQHHQAAWNEIPQNQWNDRDPEMESDTLPKVQPVEQSYIQSESALPEDKNPKSGNLQALVDAIGTRMKDIESAVQRMSEKVQKAPDVDPGSGEKTNISGSRSYNVIEPDRREGREKTKRPAPDGESYKRGSKYLHTAAEEATTEPPLFIEDSHLNGYYSDAINTVLRRANNNRPVPLEPAVETYMAPVQSLTNRRNNIAPPPPPPTSSEDSGPDKKPRKKKVHKKKHIKSSHHKKHRPKDDKRKKFRLNSVELDKNAVSLDESGPNVNNNNNN